MTSSTRLGIVLMIGGVVSLTLMDVFSKFALVAVSPIALVYVRAVGSTVILGAVRGCATELFHASSRLKAALACCATAYLVAILSFFWSLAHIPLGEVVTLNVVAPLIMVVLSWTTLKEPFALGTAMAVVLGGLGAILIGGSTPDGLELGDLVVLLGATAYAIVQILSKSLSEQVTPETLTFSSQLGVSLILLPVLRIGPLDEVVDHPFLFIAVLGTSLTGQLLIQAAIRRSLIGTLAPFEYVAVPLSFIFGSLIWEEWPTATGIWGAALIVVAGLIAWRVRHTNADSN